MGIKWLANCQIELIGKKEHEEVKINRYGGTNRNFLSHMHVHYRDPYFDFRD